MTAKNLSFFTFLLFVAGLIIALASKPFTLGDCLAGTLFTVGWAVSLKESLTSKRGWGWLVLDALFLGFSAAITGFSWFNYLFK